MTELSDVYFDALTRIMTRVREANRESIPRAAEALATAIAGGGIVHVFGSGHSQLLAMDMAGRAGGLVPVSVIYDPARGRAETLEGYAQTLLRDVALDPTDCLIVISNSGRNASPLEVALAGRKAGLAVVAVTSLAFSTGITSRHSSGQKLYQVADVVLDLCGEAGDAVAPLASGIRVGPTSTAIGSALLQATMAATAQRLEEAGVEPPVLLSQNLDGAADRNAELRARYRGRVAAVL